jgi:hypothetical protein
VEDISPSGYDFIEDAVDAVGDAADAVGDFVQDSCTQSIVGMYAGIGGLAAATTATGGAAAFGYASAAASYGFGTVNIAEGECHDGESSFD